MSQPPFPENSLLKFSLRPAATMAGCSFTIKTQIMSYTPYTNLQATPDFANFQFTSPTKPEPTIRHVRFTGQQGGRIYQVDIRDDQASKKFDYSWVATKDYLCVVLTLIQIIEIYLERYPRRILGFRGNTLLNCAVFMAMFERYGHLLTELFLIDKATPKPFSLDSDDRHDLHGDGRYYPYILRRKPIPFFSVHTIESTWNGTSRIFKNDFSVELDTNIRIGLNLPTI